MGQYTEAVQKLYVAYFNRPGDVAGQTYWEGVVANAKGSTAAVSAAFAASPEYKAAFAGMDEYHVVNTVYMNLFGRPAEPAGLQYWGQALINKTFTIDSVVTQIAGGAQGTDLTAYNDKVQAATAFTNAINTAGTTAILSYSGDAANAVAKSFLSTVTTDATLATAIAPANLASVITSMSNVPGQTFALSTSVDTLVGTANNDLFTVTVTGAGPVSTLGTFDSINGAGGNDTLQIVDTGTAAGSALVSATNVTVTSVENLSVTTSGSVGGGSAYDVSGYTGLTKATFLSAGTGAADNNVKVADTTAASLAVVAGNTVITGGNVDTIVNNSAAGTATVTGNGLTNVSVKGGGAVTIDNTSGGTTSVGTTMTTVTIDGNTGGATIKGKAIANVAVKNIAAAATETILNATAKHTLNLSLSDAGKTGQVVTVADTNAETITVATAGGDNNVLLNTGAVLKTVTATGSSKMTLDLNSGANTAVTSFDGSASTGDITLKSVAAGTVTVKTGAGADTFTLLQTAKATVDAGAGNDTVTVSSVIAAGSTISLGAGNDTIKGGGSFASGATVVDGGDGTDTVAAALVTAGSASMFKNFEQLDLTGYNAVIDATLIAGSTITGLVESGIAATVNTASIQNVAATASILVTGAIDQATLGAGNLGSVTTTQAAGSTMAINFSAAPAAANTLGGNFATLGTVTTTGDKTISISSTGGSNLDGNGVASIVDTGNTVTKITITGDKAFTLGGVTQAGGPSALTMIDGSAATGKLTLTAVTAGSGYAAGFTITGGSADDTISSDIVKAVLNGGAGKDVINASGANQTINGGDGDDTINVTSTGASNIVTVNGGAGADTLSTTLAYGTTATAASSATTGSMTAFADAGSTDVIKFANIVNASGKLGAITSVAAAQTFDQAVFAADTVANAAGNTVVWFQYAGNTYVMDNVTAVNSTDNVIVKLTGAVDLSNAVVVTGASGTITLA